MRILLFSQYFVPEVTAASARMGSLVRHLAGSGHDVEVICEVPNHPAGIVEDGYGRRPIERRELEGAKVRYVWVRTSPVKTRRSRLLFYGSYAAMATVAGLATRRPDVVFVSSPPLPAAAAAMTVARARRVPWVMDVRDPWPEAAVALGELTDSRLIRAFERLERRLYKSASAVVTVTEPVRAEVAAKTEDPGKVVMVPNGTTDEWLAAGERDEDRGDLGMPAGRFVLTYAGNVGLAQGIEACVEAAAELGDDFQLQIVGTGPRLEAVREAASRLPEGRVVFRGLVPPELAARYLRASDATLVPLGKKPELAKFVPSKLFDCCAVGRPVILSAAGEPARLAGEAAAALCIPPEDPSALVESVQRLRREPRLASALVEAGRDFAQRNRRELGAETIEGVLSEALDASPRSPAAGRP